MNKIKINASAHKNAINCDKIHSQFSYKPFCVRVKFLFIVLFIYSYAY